MAIRLPLQTVAFFDDSTETGTNSVAGMVPHTFQIPVDTDNIVVKLTASVAGAGVSAVLQTSDDGGTTYYDIARTSIVSNAPNAAAQFLTASTMPVGVRTTSVTASASITGGGGIGSPSALGLSQNAITGLPLLGIQNRVGIIITGNVTVATANSIKTTISCNNQSASHN